MGWERVWTLALVQFGAEDIELRILIGLGLAFVMLMIVEGLRASFRPGRPQHLSVPEGREVAASVIAQKSAKPAIQPFRAQLVAVRTKPKRMKPAVNRHRPPRPAIRRVKSARSAPTFTEESAPYTPLSPKL